MSLKEQMPFVAAVMADLREVFGDAGMDEVMRKRNSNGFYAKEGDIELGKKDASGIEFTLDQIVIQRPQEPRKPAASTKRTGRFK